MTPQLEQVLGEHQPDVAKVISQYANQTVLAEPLMTLMGSNAIGFHVTDQQGLHRDRFDVLEATPDRILIRVSSQGQLKLLESLGEPVDLPTSPIRYHFDLRLEPVKGENWAVKTSNITGAYRALGTTVS